MRFIIILLTTLAASSAYAGPRDDLAICWDASETRGPLTQRKFEQLVKDERVRPQALNQAKETRRKAQKSFNLTRDEARKKFWKNRDCKRFL